MKSQTKTNDIQIWVIRAGEGGEAHDLFMKQNLIVLSHTKMGDLRLLPKERLAFYDAYASRHPEKGRVSIRGIGGKFFRYMHEVKIEDQVLYPCIRDKRIYIGNVTSEYRYDPSLNSQFPHHRNVNWHVAIPKNSLSESAQRELGAARTFFRYKNHAEEIQRLLAKNLKPGRPNNSFQ